MQNKIVLWPIYFDSHASRKWRKIPKELAVSNPTIDEIFKAARKLGFHAVKEEKSHPARWWRKEGCVVVEKKEKKAEIIKKIAEIIKAERKEA